METLINNLIQATGWSILHSLWQGALIYALILPFQLNLFKLTARFKYNLAYAAHFLMLVCFITTFSSIFRWPAASLTLSVIPGPNNLTPTYVSSIPLMLSRYAELLFPYLVLLYSVGFIVQCIIVFTGYSKVQLLKKAAYVKIPEDWKILFKGLTRSMKISKAIDFRISDQIHVPLVIGFFKPVILFPIALVNQMDLKQVEAILIHELSHIRRNDYLFNLIRTVVDTVLFFNPFVWLTGKFIDIEREHACDDMVVKTTHTPITYAHALLTLELITDKSSPTFSLAATGTEQHLYQRIKRITDMKTNYTNSKQKLFAITLTIATIVSLAWISPAKNEKKSERTLIRPSNTVMFSSDINPIDTGKKKTKKVVKINGNIAPPPPPAEPVMPPAPERPERPELLEMPEMPEPPEAPEIEIMSPLTLSLSSSIADFAIKIKDLALSEHPDEAEIKRMQADIEKQGAELQKQFDSPAQKAKWKKYQEEMEAKFNSPEAKAKWEKYGREMDAKFNSPEAKAKWQLKLKENQAKYNSLEEREKYKNLMSNIDVQIKKAIASEKVALVTAQKVQKVQRSQEYQNLKKKYDKDLEELYKKKLQEDQK